MNYLTSAEALVYADMLPVTDSQISYASAMIDAWVGLNKGQSKFITQATTDPRVKLNKKNKAKLKYSPVISIDSAEAILPSPMGQPQTMPVDPLSIVVDEYGYLEYIGGAPNMQYGYLQNTYNIWNAPVTMLNVTYTYGYSAIPEAIKRACGMIAMNIAQMGSFTNIDTRSDLDTRISLSDPSLITKDIRSLLSPYRSV